MDRRGNPGENRRPWFRPERGELIDGGIVNGLEDFPGPATARTKKGVQDD